MIRQILSRPLIDRARRVLIFWSMGLVPALLATPLLAQVSVLTQNNDNGRDAVYANETVLTPSAVQQSSFGKRFTVTLDSQVRDQVLILSGVSAPGMPTNIMIAFTSSDSTSGGPSSLWGFNADTGAKLWQHSFGNVPRGNSGTPVIDRTVGANGAVYLLTNTTSTLLHAIDPTTGNELPGSPTTVTAPGFTSGQENQRSAMLLQNGVVYVSFAHLTDAGTYHGFVIGYQYNGSSFVQTGVYNVTPSGNGGGIWSGGDGAVADAAGNVYVETGNGSFDASSGGSNCSMSVLKLAPSTLALQDGFAPSDAVAQSNVDADLNGGGMVLIPGTSRLFLGPTKFGALILVDAANLGHSPPIPSRDSLASARRRGEARSPGAPLPARSRTSGPRARPSNSLPTTRAPAVSTRPGSSRHRPRVAAARSRSPRLRAVRIPFSGRLAVAACMR